MADPKDPGVTGMIAGGTWPGKALTRLALRMPRVALIHALAESVRPVNDELARVWPACDRINLLDDSLSADLARSSAGLDAAMTERFLRLAGYAILAGADGILFTCSAFGPCIEAVARRHPELPVLKPNEALIAEAATRPGRLGLVATFGHLKLFQLILIGGF